MANIGFGIYDYKGSNAYASNTVVNNTITNIAVF